MLVVFNMQTNTNDPENLQQMYSNRTGIKHVNNMRTNMLVVFNMQTNTNDPENLQQMYSNRTGIYSRCYIYIHVFIAGVIYTSMYL